MNVFIDANILLSFFHYTKDDLKTLKQVFTSHSKGGSKVVLTEQVVDEFYRNREARLNDALTNFDKISTSARLPSFMEEFQAHDDVLKIGRKFAEKMKELRAEAKEDIDEENLIGDVFVKQLFARAKPVPASDEDIAAAERRMKVGNPPGKKASLGDAISWEILLRHVKNGEDLHIVSGDADFASDLDSDRVGEFLRREWKEKKNSNIYLYKDLSSFFKRHAVGKELSFDAKKQDLINRLRKTGSFAETHAVVAELEAYENFSQAEASQIYAAAEWNWQFGGIEADRDVRDLLIRAGEPHKSQLTHPDKERLNRIKDD